MTTEAGNPEDQRGLIAAAGNLLRKDLLRLLPVLFARRFPPAGDRRGRHGAPGSAERKRDNHGVGPGWRDGPSAKVRHPARFPHAG